MRDWSFDRAESRGVGFHGRIPLKYCPLTTDHRPLPHSLPLQHPHHPIKILQRPILNHNPPPPLPIPNSHPHAQHFLQRPLRRLHIPIHPPRAASLIRLLPSDRRTHPHHQLFYLPHHLLFFL